MESIIKILALVTCLFFSLSALAAEFTPIPYEKYQELLKLRDNQLKYQISTILKRRYNSTGYKKAKEIIFKRLDRHDGKVCCVYENKCMKVSRVPDHKIMNVEHTWPQSKGASGKAKSDLHHLFPTLSKVNSRRSNFPFCDVVKVNWQGKFSRQGYDKKGHICFEAPREHKGNIARAMFYFSVRYNIRIDRDEESVLKKWHILDPVDQAEIDRNRKIYNYQKNSNIFVEHPELVKLVSDY